MMPYKNIFLQKKMTLSVFDFDDDDIVFFHVEYVKVSFEWRELSIPLAV